MGLLDILGTVATVADMFIDHDEKFIVKCDTIEVFQIGDSWQGTVRVHGAGTHVSSDSVSYSTTIKLPESGNTTYTPRGLLRKQLRDWLGEKFSIEGSIPKEAVVLNASENCLSFEGYAKKVSGIWKMTSSLNSATHFVAYKLFVYHENNKQAVGHDELFELFKAPTVGYVTSVDVHDGF